MRILVTGHNGFVGRHVYNAFNKTDEVICLEACDTFHEWIDKMHGITSEPFDVVLHIGALSDNQSDRPDIFLWNALGTQLLAESVLAVNVPYFVFFSSSVVRGTSGAELKNRTNYGWSKLMGENFLIESYRKIDSDEFCILCPGVMWGDEGGSPGRRSVPYRLATHTLTGMFRGWVRDYVHVDDVVKALKVCVKRRNVGIYDLMTGIDTVNEDLAKMVDWDGFEWLDDPRAHGFKQFSEHISSCNERVPFWEPSVRIGEKLRRFEAYYEEGKCPR